MSKGKKKSAPTAATVQSANLIQQNQNNTTEEEAQEVKCVQDKIWNCFNDIVPNIYMAERLLQSFREQYFSMSVEAFEENETTKRNFVWSFEYMQAQLWSLGNILFDIRLKCEFVDGNKDERIIAAHIRNEDEMRSWLQQS
ncbi:hypothetical protein HMPREF1141_0549 [Clostridium sp. MSTE9]|uniref:hypothetical protein n=1 Tax=Clostridium sp. (strain MSTE9) TaxID=1105031 RepID=UPI00026F2430|nr:hypothetical protein [Clostridium sp. MSTE9]EJF39217.1 hypothetical protein HMPREF1141_0549 [Clostridium sp. MSTE9]